jgi:hypothetical protein
LTVLNGKICSSDGLPLEPEVKASAGTLKISLDGQITVAGKPVGRVVLSVFSAGALLSREGNYAASETKGSLCEPGDLGAGVIRSVLAVGTSRQPIKTATTPVADSGPITVRVNPATEIEGDQVLLSEVAEFDGSGSSLSKLQSVNLGPAAYVGLKRTLSSSSVTAAILKAGITRSEFVLEVPPVATVVRKGQVVRGESMHIEAIASVKEKLGIDSEVDTNRPLVDLMAPLGVLEIKVVSVENTAKSITAQLSICVDGKEFVKRTAYLVPSASAVQVKAYDKVMVRMVRNGLVVEASGTSRSAALLGQKVNVIVEETGATLTMTA